MAAAVPQYLPLYRPFPASLVSRPPVPVRDAVEVPSPPVATGASVASQGHTALQAMQNACSDRERSTEAVRRGGLTVQLDIAVERRRSFWWRLVAKLQLFRS